MEHFGCIVNKLIRVNYGPFNLANLKPGEVLQANKRDVEKFVKSLL
jgi:16S rRNA U516 pseudouridylate synthase RsuA-like enzyme